MTVPVTLSRFRLDGKVAVVTGVGPTNGRSISLALAEAGADVCVVARSSTVIEETAHLIEEMGRRALPVRADMTDSVAVDAMAARVAAELGSIDVLCNHSGTGAEGYYGPMLEISDEAWERTLRQTLTSVMQCTRAVAKVMVDRGGGGSIINTSSVASVMTPRDVTAYAVAKAAVNHYTRCMAVELALYSIRVNAILLGTFENAGPKLPEDFRNWWLDAVPMRRWGRADEVAPAVLYLASDASSFVTGELLRISGGIGI